MRARKTTKEWLLHVVLALAYVSVYMALGAVSSSQWVLRAGLRLACLLFLPYRYWPTLIFAEVLPMAKISIECYDEYGPAYAFGKLIPPMAYVAPIVWWCRARLSLFGPKQKVRISVLLVCVLLLALVTAARDMALVYMIRTPHVVFAEWASGFFLGNYLGILTVVPLAIVLRDFFRETKASELWERVSHSRFAMDSIALMLPSLVLLAWVASHAHSEFALVSRMTLFVPVAWLALRHGWRGAAVGGTAASVAIAILTPRLYDPATLQAEVFISFTISTMLLLGARITALNTRDETDRQNTYLALQVAQQGLYMGELRMRSAADAIEQIAMSFQQTQGRVLERIRHVLTPTEEQSISKQVIASRYEAFQVANSLAPRAFQTHGLACALRDASIARAFAAANVEFECDIKGNDLDSYEPGAQLALYRLACEAASYLYEQATLTSVQVQVRAGATNGRRWVVVRMDGTHATGTQDLMPALLACGHFRKQLGASGLDINGLRDHAYLYGGMIHLRSTARGTRLALLLHDIKGVPAASRRVN